MAHTCRTGSRYSTICQAQEEQWKLDLRCSSCCECCGCDCNYEAAIKLVLMDEICAECGVEYRAAYSSAADFDLDAARASISAARPMDDYSATMIAEGVQDASEDDQLRAWQHLIDTGLAWRLQGFFGRAAENLIEQGVCHR